MLEEKIVVTLYELTSRGYLIEHDSPAIGCWEEYGRWSKIHSLYGSKSAAEDALKELLGNRVYRRDERNPLRVYISGPSSAETVEVIHRDINKENIAVDGKGQYSYKGIEVIL